MTRPLHLSSRRIDKGPPTGFLVRRRHCTPGNDPTASAVKTSEGVRSDGPRCQPDANQEERYRPLLRALHSNVNSSSTSTYVPGSTFMAELVGDLLTDNTHFFGTEQSLCPFLSKKYAVNKHL
jgi:hypothetical protein